MSDKEKALEDKEVSPAPLEPTLPRFVWVSLQNRKLERGPDGEIRLAALEHKHAN